jgi:hypothetical protein
MEIWVRFTCSERADLDLLEVGDDVRGPAVKKKEKKRAQARLLLPVRPGWPALGRCDPRACGVGWLGQTRLSAPIGQIFF